MPRLFSYLFLVLAPLAVHAQTVAARCDPLAGAFVLPRLAAALAAHQLRLLVVAPAAQSPAGADTGADDGSLAFRIKAALQALRPDLAIDLDTIDNAGLSVADMMPIVADRLAQRPVALVIWQAGTAEISRAEPAARVSSSLADAVRLAFNSGADLILVDPDPDPLFDKEPDFAPIEASLAQTAAHPGVAFYRQDATPACTSRGIADLIGKG